MSISDSEETPCTPECSPLPQGCPQPFPPLLWSTQRPSPFICSECALKCISKLRLFGVAFDSQQAVGMVHTPPRFKWGDTKEPRALRAPTEHHHPRNGAKRLRRRPAPAWPLPTRQASRGLQLGRCPPPPGKQPGTWRFLSGIQVAGNHFQKSPTKSQELVILLIITNELRSRKNMQNQVYKTRLLGLQKHAKSLKG